MSTMQAVQEKALANLGPQKDLVRNDGVEEKPGPAGTNMAHRIVLWWILLSTPVFLWDTALIFMRPRSLKGGDLRWIWRPYDRLEEVDYLYGKRAYDLTDGFFGAMVVTNLLELSLQLLYVYHRHIPRTKTRARLANVYLFAGACMAFDKLLLVCVQEHFCGYCNLKHNAFQDLLEVYIIPNSVFVLFPVFMIFVSGRELLL